MRDTKDPIGYPKDLWQSMVQLGWAGMAIPDEFDLVFFLNRARVTSQSATQQRLPTGQ
jgi:alkylation response protein AidB-like acyl-CoA dehydrogenase